MPSFACERLRFGHLVVGLLMILTCAGSSGCGWGSYGFQPFKTEYGGTRNKSINGFDTFVKVLQDWGHEAYPTAALRERATQDYDVIVRLARRGGPLSQEENDFYLRWLGQNDSRKLVYILPGYDSEAEVWEGVLKNLGPENTPEEKSRVRSEITNSPPKMSPFPNMSFRGAKPTISPLFETTTTPKNPQGVGANAKSAPAPGTVVIPGGANATAAVPQGPATLGGPWAENSEVDPVKAELPVAWGVNLPAIANKKTLLTVNGWDFVVTGRAPVVQSTTYGGNFSTQGGEVLVVSNAAFLSNGGLLNQERRKLMAELLDWISGNDLMSKKVLIIQGSDPLSQADQHILHVFKTPPMDKVMPHWIVLGLLACWARAFRLGRARPDPPKRDDRVVGHPEALGDLMFKVGDDEIATKLLERYRHWRRPTIGLASRRSTSVGS